MRKRLPQNIGPAVLLLAAVAQIQEGHAAAFASRVIDYLPGSGTSLDNPSSALGQPLPVVGLGTGFDSILTPFNPHYESGQIVQIGEGGSLTLQLSHYALASPGLPEIGVFSNIGIIDTDWPNGVAGTVLSATSGSFGIDSTLVEVSADGASWHEIGIVILDQPSNFYADLPTPTTLDVDGLTAADFGLSHANTLADYAGKDWGAIISQLGSSAGGTWFDIEPSGLDRAGWVRFSLPDDGNPNTTLSVEIDAVSIENRVLGSAIPEPSAVTLIGFGLLLFYWRRRG